MLLRSARALDLTAVSTQAAHAVFSICGLAEEITRILDASSPWTEEERQTEFHIIEMRLGIYQDYVLFAIEERAFDVPQFIARQRFDKTLAPKALPVWPIKISGEAGT